MVTHSCLENPTDRGAWQAAGHRVTQNQTRLKWFSTHWLSPVLVISYYVKNHPKLSVLAWQIFTNTISVDQESGSDLVGKFWLKISHVVTGKGPLGLQASQGLNRIRIISKQTHQLLAGPSPLPHGHFHQLPEGSYDTVVVPVTRITWCLTGSFSQNKGGATLREEEGKDSRYKQQSFYKFMKSHRAWCSPLYGSKSQFNPHTGEEKQSSFRGEYQKTWKRIFKTTILSLMV